jgi:hypothetical protein
MHVAGVICKTYRARPRDDPDYFCEPEIPDVYRPVSDLHGAQIGGYICGRVLRLNDGALGMSCYACMEGNLRRRDQFRSHYVSKRPDEGVAEEATENMLTSSLMLRSEDEGRTWYCASTIGRIDENKPFDGGVLYSEGFNETGLAYTAEGDLLALMRHGSYHLIWANRSADDGRTWQGIEPLNHPGVFPCLVRLGNGVLAAAWGRPGMTVAFSLDGGGRYWHVLTEVMRDDEPSQKYPWLVPITDDSVLLFYDRRRWDAAARRFTDHGIYSRRIVCRPDSCATSLS